MKCYRPLRFPDNITGILLIWASFVRIWIPYGYNPVLVIQSSSVLTGAYPGSLKSKIEKIVTILIQTILANFYEK